MKNKAFVIGLLGAIVMSPALAGGLNGEVANCDNANILQMIDQRFDKAKLNKDVVAIDSIDKVHQHRLVNASSRSPIARRYCGAVAHMSDGRQRTLWYLIEDGMGLAGFGDNVEFCLSGYNKMKAYGGRCRVLR